MDLESIAKRLGVPGWIIVLAGAGYWLLDFSGNIQFASQILGISLPEVPSWTTPVVVLIGFALVFASRWAEHLPELRIVHTNGDPDYLERATVPTGNGSSTVEEHAYFRVEAVGRWERNVRVSLEHCLANDGQTGQAFSVHHMPLALRMRGRPYQLRSAIGPRGRWFRLVSYRHGQCARQATIQIHAAVPAHIAVPSENSAPLGSEPKLYRLMVKAVSGRVECRQWFAVAIRGGLDVRTLPSPDLQLTYAGLVQMFEGHLASLGQSGLLAVNDPARVEAFRLDVEKFGAAYEEARNLLDDFTKSMLWDVLMTLRSTYGNLHPDYRRKDEFEARRKLAHFTSQRAGLDSWFQLARRQLCSGTPQVPPATKRNLADSLSLTLREVQRELVRKTHQGENVYHSTALIDVRNTGDYTAYNVAVRVEDLLPSHERIRARRDLPAHLVEIGDFGRLSDLAAMANAPRSFTLAPGQGLTFCVLMQPENTTGVAGVLILCVAVSGGASLDPMFAHPRDPGATGERLRTRMVYRLHVRATANDVKPNDAFYLITTDSRNRLVFREWAAGDKPSDLPSRS